MRSAWIRIAVLRERSSNSQSNEFSTMATSIACIYGKGGKRKHLAVPIGESLSKPPVVFHVASAFPLSHHNRAVLAWGP
jgi:hypothetical protein